MEKKNEYETLIKRDLDFLKTHCPDTEETKHIRLILKSSIVWLYPDAAACRALRKIESHLAMELEKQKVEGKGFLSDEEIDEVINGIIKETKED